MLPKLPGVINQFSYFFSNLLEIKFFLNYNKIKRVEEWNKKALEILASVTLSDIKLFLNCCESFYAYRRRSRVSLWDSTHCMVVILNWHGLAAGFCVTTMTPRWCRVNIDDLKIQTLSTPKSQTSPLFPQGQTATPDHTRSRRHQNGTHCLHSPLDSAYKVHSKLEGTSFIYEYFNTRKKSQNFLPHTF